MRPSGLDSLLTSLRHAGLPVGVAEVARLREIFALSPQLTSPRLCAVLRAVLVKSVEERDLFERIFDAWLARAELELSSLTTPKGDVTVPGAPFAMPRLRRPRRLFWLALAPATLVVASLFLGGHGAVPPEEAIRTTPPKKQSTTSTLATSASPAEIRKRTFTTSVPTLVVTLSKPVWLSWPPLLLGVLALSTAGGLWLALRRRRWFPEPAPLPAKKGPPRVFLTPPVLAGPQLLAPREQEALVWGIGQFVAEEPTRRLDLAATVRATAQAGGLPHLKFHLARHSREVWLWIDEAADDPAIQRLADEVETALLASGLPVERTLFRGVPDWLIDSTGRSFAPNEVDERRDAALVAILTDGRLLARQYAAADLRVGLDALLRGLSHWPHLAFVDFSRGPGELAGILARHSLEHIAPAELAAFLGSDESMRRQARASGIGNAAWAAACALAPTSVDEARAFELRRQLGLAISPWAVRDLRAEAPGPPGRLQWRLPDRARRVNWLREAEKQPETSVADGSLLGNALTFWESSYDRELETLEPETPAYQHLTMERALLGLWRDAPNAVRTLYRLYGGVLREVVPRHLGALAPLDWGRSELLHLPWRWSERSGPEQVMLQKMGFGGGMPVTTLERPGRLWVGLGICLGLAGGALAMAALSGTRLPEGPPVLVKCRTGETLVEAGMEFVRICPGTFMMGSAENDIQAYDGERPAHRVTLSEYWIGKDEVTIAQYRQQGWDTRPATSVSWFEAQGFCEKHGWRLPTEAEWENAARAGTRTAWSFGDDATSLGDFAWFEGNSEKKLHPVGTRKPNLWGLYDMHGNAWEWVASWYAPYNQEPQTDPLGPATGTARVLRGGAFGGPPGFLRSADRGGFEPSVRNRIIGFRCARDASPPGPLSHRPPSDRERGRR